MEQYKIYFMLFSAIYLFIFGVFMKKQKGNGVNRTVGLVTILFSIFSLTSAAIGYFNGKLGASLYNIFVVILIGLSIGISIINLLVKKKS